MPVPMRSRHTGNLVRVTPQLLPEGSYIGTTCQRYYRSSNNRRHARCPELVLGHCSLAVWRDIGGAGYVVIETLLRSLRSGGSAIEMDLVVQSFECKRMKLY